MDNKMKAAIVSLFESNGWTNSTHQLKDSLYFTIPLSEQDKEAIKAKMGKDHFIPNGTRNAYVAGGGTLKYITSNIRGRYRKYFHRIWYPDTDILNIFAHEGKDQLENSKLFLKAYKENQFNNAAQ